MVWLRAKAAQTAVATGASKPEEALPVLSEYVPENLFAALADSYGVAVEEARGERATLAERAAILGGGGGGAMTVTADADTVPGGPKGTDPGKRKSASTFSSKGESRAAKRVKKVDTSGMKGLSSFFKKKT